MVQQPADGYIWVATRSGLYQFDGVQFKPFVPLRGEPIRSKRIIVMMTGTDGSLWVGTGSDVERFKDNALTHFPSDVGHILGTVISIEHAKDGKIWISRARAADDRGPLCEVAAELTCYGSKDGINLPSVNGVIGLPDGSLLLVGSGAGYQWDPRTRAPARQVFSLPGTSDGIQSSAWNLDGALMFGSARSGYGLSTLQGNQLVPFVIPGFDGRNISVTSITFDSHKAMWLGTQGEGIYRIADGKVEHYQASDGLSGNTIYSIFEDREGNVWVCTSQGLDRFRDVKIATFSSREGFGNDLVNAVTAAPDGSIWTSNWHTLEVIDRGVVRSLRAGKEVPGDQVTSVYADRAGRVWVGVDDGLTYYVNGKFVPLLDQAGKRIGTVNSMVEDKQGDLWVRTHAGPTGTLLRIAGNKVVESVSVEQLPYGRSIAIAGGVDGGVWLPLTGGDVGLWHDGLAHIIKLNRPAGSGVVQSITPHRDGTIFAGTAQGLYVARGDKVQWLNDRNGLPCTEIFTTLTSGDVLWIYSSCGVLSIDYAELERWWANSEVTIKVGQIGPLDGAQAAAAGWSPRASQSPDGRLWFANGSVAQVFDPKQAAGNPLPPPVHVTGIVADRNSYSAEGSVELPAQTRNLEIAYTALSLSIPEKINFRYRLEGHDDQWIEAGNRRQAFYTDLAPGEYRFQVIASNNDGIWNMAGATVSLEVLPALYQTLWFRTLSVLLVLALIYIAYLWRVRHLAQRMQLKVEARTREREHIARELHDTLLQSMQGLIYTLHAAMQRLPETEPVRHAIASALASADESLLRGRAQVQGLRRLSTASSQSLDLALDELTARLLRDRGCRVAVHFAGDKKPLAAGISEEVTAICLEALNNALRHAGATELDIDVQYGYTQLIVEVRDNGRGFDVRATATLHTEGHFGLVGMRERALRVGGTLEIESQTGSGALIRCRIPARFAYVDASTPPLLSWLRRTFGSSQADER